MDVWRLCQAPYTALDGEGTRLYGNRWNSAGLAVTYAATSLSLAVLEYLVHVDADLLPDNLVAMHLEVPDGPYPTILEADLPPPDQAEWYLATGDAWLRSGASLVLIVPSVIVRVESNLLINPQHPDMARVRVRDVRPFSLDARLLH